MADVENYSASWKPHYNPWIVALTVTLATFMEVLDTSIANVPLPHIAGGLSAGQDESTWVLTSYLISNAIVLPMSGWLTNLIGRKRFYMTCVALFTASSILCGFAPSQPMLILFRIFQGAGGGGMGPSEQAILADTFPAEKRGLAFSVYGMAVVVAPAIGPTLGGWITDNYDWRWIFFINVPVGLLSLFLTSQVVEDPPWLRGHGGKGIKNDYIGLSLIVMGLGFLQVVLDRRSAGRLVWLNSHHRFLHAGAGSAHLARRSRVATPSSHPGIEAAQEPQFRRHRALQFRARIGALRHHCADSAVPATHDGLHRREGWRSIVPAGFMLMVLFPIAGILSTRIDPRWMIACGFGMTAISLYHLTNLNLAVDFRTMVLWRMYQMSGLAFIFIPVSILSYLGVPRNKSNQVSGISNFVRNLGGSVGISMLTTFLARQSQVHQTNLVAHATNPRFSNMLNGSAATMAKSGSGPVVALQQAYNQVMGVIQQQAALLSWVNAFWVVSVIVACLVPLPFLLKKPKPGEAPAAGAH
jgi:DHA2 family multidrug resistance protein